MHAPIWLNFGTHTIVGLKANTRIKFGVNLTNIQGDISSFTHKAKSNFCQACRINHFNEHAENWYVAKLNIKGVPLGG